jgi:hypothetical protein
LAELLGIDDLLPVYVERKWQGNLGSLSWWLPVKMDEVERHKQNLTAPDADAWNNQMYKVRRSWRSSRSSSLKKAIRKYSTDPFTQPRGGHAVKTVG